MNKKHKFTAETSPTKLERANAEIINAKKAIMGPDWAVTRDQINSRVTYQTLAGTFPVIFSDDGIIRVAKWLKKQTDGTRMILKRMVYLGATFESATIWMMKEIPENLCAASLGKFTDLLMWVLAHEEFLRGDNNPRYVYTIMRVRDYRVIRALASVDSTLTRHAIFAAMQDLKGPITLRMLDHKSIIRLTDHQKVAKIKSPALRSRIEWSRLGYGRVVPRGWEGPSPRDLCMSTFRLLAEALSGGKKPATYEEIEYLAKLDGKSGVPKNVQMVRAMLVCNSPEYRKLSELEKNKRAVACIGLGVQSYNRAYPANRFSAIVRLTLLFRRDVTAALRYAYQCRAASYENDPLYAYPVVFQYWFPTMAGVGLHSMIIESGMVLPLEKLDKAWMSFARTHSGHELFRVVMTNYKDIERMVGGAPTTMTQIRKAYERVGVTFGESLVPNLTPKEIEFIENNKHKDHEECPNVEIVNGEYRLIKLAHDDVRQLTAGRLVDCCQRLGAAASDCAEKAWTSASCAIYATFKGKIMVAQAFAWMGEDGSLVFDSVETSETDSVDKVASMYVEAANVIVEKLGVTRVLIGRNTCGMTPNVIGLLGRGHRRVDTPDCCVDLTYSDTRSGCVVIASRASVEGDTQAPIPLVPVPRHSTDDDVQVAISSNNRSNRYHMLITTRDEMYDRTEISIHSDPTSNLHAATRSYVDTAISDPSHPTPIPLGGYGIIEPATPTTTPEDLAMESRERRSPDWLGSVAPARTVYPVTAMIGADAWLLNLIYPIEPREWSVDNPLPIEPLDAHRTQEQPDQNGGI